MDKVLVYITFSVINWFFSLNVSLLILTKKPTWQKVIDYSIYAENEILLCYS